MLPPPPPPPPSKGGGKGVAAAWEKGEVFLPPNSDLPTLKDRAASVAAGLIDRAPEVSKA